MGSPYLHKLLLTNSQYRRLFESLGNARVRSCGSKHLFLEGDKKYWVEVTPSSENGELPLFDGGKIKPRELTAKDLATSEFVLYSDPRVKERYGVVLNVREPSPGIENVVVREYIPGVELSRISKRELEKMEGEEWEPLVMVVAETVESFHNLGYSHNDVNPTNIIFSPKFEEGILVDLETASSLRPAEQKTSIPPQPPELDYARVLLSSAYLLRKRKRCWRKFCRRMLDSFPGNLNPEVLVSAVEGVERFYSNIDSSNYRPWAWGGIRRNNTLWKIARELKEMIGGRYDIPYTRAV